MLLTITQSGTVSTTGTFTKDQLDPGPALINTAQPAMPTVPYTDPNVGAYGGLLYICDAALKPGDVVFAGVTALAIGGPQRYVRKARAGEMGPVLGVVTAKPRDTVAEVVHAGVAPVFSGLVIGKRYYLAPDGTLCTPPLDLDGLIYVHFIGYAVATDTLMVLPSYPLVKRSNV